MSEGKKVLNKHVSYGILLMGTTGSGKSTLANAFSAKEVEAVLDDEKGDIKIQGDGIA